MIAGRACSVSLFDPVMPTQVALQLYKFRLTQSHMNLHFYYEDLGFNMKHT